MKYVHVPIIYWIFASFATVKAINVVAYTDLVTAYDFKSISAGTFAINEDNVYFGYFRAPATGLYQFGSSIGDTFWLGYDYECCSLSSNGTPNIVIQYSPEFQIYLIEGFYYSLVGINDSTYDLNVLVTLPNGSLENVSSYLYSPPPTTIGSADYNINTISGSYLLATTTSGTVSKITPGFYTTQFYGQTTTNTIEAMFTVVPYSVVTSYATSSTIFTTPTTINDVSTNVVVDVIATSVSSSSSIISSGSSSVSSIISSVQGSVSSSTSASTIPVQTYIWTADYTSTITMTLSDGYISVPSGGLFKRDLAYETAVLIPTPTSIDWSNSSIYTTVVEYVELYANGQTSAIDVTYTRPVSSAGFGSFGSSSTSTTTITTRSTVTSTETSVQTVTKYATATGVVTSSSGSIATTRTTTATTPGSGVSSYTDVVTTTNSLGQTVVYTELVVVLPESVSSSTAASSNSTSTGVVTTVNDVGETIVATDIVVYCPESTRSTIGSVSATSSSVVTSVNSTETLVYTEVVVYCPESTRTAAGSVSSTSTGLATTTNAEGATITYTDIVIYCPESEIASTGITSSSITTSGKPTSTITEQLLASRMVSASSRTIQSQSNYTNTSDTFVEYQGIADKLELKLLSSVSVSASFFAFILLLL